MTGKRKYAARAAAEAHAVCAFSDWNPSHFLDVAEMTLAIALARDWLDDALSEDDRRIFEESIVMKGLTVGDGKTLSCGWWTNSENNWNQVCNGSLSAGAAVVRDHYPELAEAVLRRSRKCLAHSMKSYAGGNFPEGPGYWYYATDYTAIALNVLERQFVDGVPELFASKGLVEQIDYLELMTGPTGLLFNYSDPFCSATAVRVPSAARCYLGFKFGRSRTSLDEFAYMHGDHDFGRMLPFALLWFRDNISDNVPKPISRALGGTNPVVILRTGTGTDDWYLGIKAGTPSANHGHMDGGSFILDAGGVRWAFDLGCEDYNRIEQKKTVNLWNMGQDSSRWSLFRLNTNGHGTLMIDNEQQNVRGMATVSSFKAGECAEAVIDLSPLYHSARSVKRTFSLSSNGLCVSDVLVGLRPNATVTWSMNTAAKVVLKGNLAFLEGKTINGKAQFMRMMALPEDVEWTAESIAQPRTPNDSPNPGMKRISFRHVVDIAGNLRLHISFALSTRTF